MKYTILRHELFELLTNERWSIVSNDFLGNTMRGKDDSELLDCFPGSNGLHQNHIHPHPQEQGTYGPDRDQQSPDVDGSMALQATSKGGEVQ